MTILIALRACFLLLIKFILFLIKRNQMADGLDLDELNQMAKNLEKENIDTSFLDEMLDDQ